MELVTITQDLSLPLFRQDMHVRKEHNRTIQVATFLSTVLYTLDENSKANTNSQYVGFRLIQHTTLWGR